MNMRFAAIIVLGLMLAGCATATFDNAVPEGAIEPDVASAEPEQSDIAVTSGGPEDTGEFPNLNEVQRGELAQMTVAEKNAYLAKLRAARAEQSAKAGGGPSKATAAKLKRIAKTHDEEALKEIENE